MINANLLSLCSWIAAPGIVWVRDLAGPRSFRSRVDGCDFQLHVSISLHPVGTECAGWGTVRLIQWNLSPVEEMTEICIDTRRKEDRCGGGTDQSQYSVKIFGLRIVKWQQDLVTVNWRGCGRKWS